MEQVCKRCNLCKPQSDFPTRRWGPAHARREGPRKICYDCQRLIDLARYNTPDSRKRARQAEWRAENAGRINAYGRAYYQENRDRWLNPETGWRFSDHARAYDAQYRGRPENKAAAQARGKEWRAANRAKLVVKTRRRQKHVARATPGWADLAAILAVYQEAERLTKTTGERHEVDHVIPLQGKHVCGLHVETNLQVITATANRRKGHKFKPVTSLSPVERS